MKDIEIKITKSTRYVDIEKETEKVGNEGENLQTNLVFSFTDTFVNGQARLEYTINGEDRYVILNKIDETYQTPIKSEMTKYGVVDMQLVITEGTDEKEIPKFKSNIFYLPYGESINAEVEQPEEYEEWIDVANTKLNEVDNLNIEMQDGIVTITRKDGTQYSEDVNGDDYVITEEDYEEIENQVKTDIQPILENIENIANESNIIARGKSSSVVRETWAEMEIWLRDVANKGKLIPGDNLWIEAHYTDETETERQPDFWITKVLEEPNEKGYYYEFSPLESEKPDLTDYAKKEQFVTLTQAEYEELSTNGTYEREDGTILIFSANTYYFIIEEE